MMRFRTGSAMSAFSSLGARVSRALRDHQLLTERPTHTGSRAGKRTHRGPCPESRHTRALCHAQERPRPALTHPGVSSACPGPAGHPRGRFHGLAVDGFSSVCRQVGSQPHHRTPNGISTRLISCACEQGIRHNREIPLPSKKRTIAPGQTRISDELLWRWETYGPRKRAVCESDAG